MQFLTALKSGCLQVFDALTKVDFLIHESIHIWLQKVASYIHTGFCVFWSKSMHIIANVKLSIFLWMYNKLSYALEN